ncbi:MAG: hypothetical protein ACTSRK_02665 [Promethearchaeota archaeon]
MKINKKGVSGAGAPLHSLQSLRGNFIVPTQSYSTRVYPQSTSSLRITCSVPSGSTIVMCAAQLNQQS